MSTPHRAAASGQLLPFSFTASDCAEAAPSVPDSARVDLQEALAVSTSDGLPGAGGVSVSEKSELVLHTLNSLPNQCFRVPYADTCFALSLVFIQLNWLIEFICDKQEYNYYLTNPDKLCSETKLIQTHLAFGVLIFAFGTFKIILEIFYNQNLLSKISQIFFGCFSFFHGIGYIIRFACDESNSCNFGPQTSALIAFSTLAAVSALLKAIVSYFEFDRFYGFPVIMPKHKEIFVKQIVQRFGNSMEMENLTQTQT